MSLVPDASLCEHSYHDVRMGSLGERGKTMEYLYSFLLSFSFEKDACFAPRCLSKEWYAFW